MHHDSPATKPTHFITGKTRIMLLLFGLILLVAIGSYGYLLTKMNGLKNTPAHNTLAPTITPRGQMAPMLDPKEFSDDNITLFYPGVLEVNDTTDGVTTWNSLVSGTIVTEKAMQLAKKTTPFEPPTNIYKTTFFAIDDIRERDSNGITILEYTINCGPRCSYRLDQFKVGNTNYQLSFLIAGPGLSPRAEQILATLRPISPTPTNPPAGGQKACTMEAKICSDGSSVGRTGPNCEFTPCPQ